VSPTAPLVAAPRSAVDRPSAGMSLLNNGIPLSLLMDLAFGPHSEELLFLERAGVPGTRPPAA
jgi:hypothetical protein